MDNFFLHLCVLCVSISLVVAFFIRQRILPSPQNNLPPGRKGWPIIGEMWDFVMASRRRTPEKFVGDRMAKYSQDVFKTSLVGENVAVFCGSAGNKFLFSNENKYVNAWWPASVDKMFAMPENFGSKVKAHKARVDLQEFLKPEALHRYIPIMDSLAKQEVERSWCHDSQVRVFQLAKEYSLVVACNLFMNLKDPSRIRGLQHHFAKIAAGLISLPIYLPGTAFYRGHKAVKIIREEIEGFVRERKEEVVDETSSTSVDMLTCMLHGRKCGDHDAEEDLHISNAIITLLIPSYDTLSITITLILYYLEKYPHIYQMVYQEQMEIAELKRSGELLNWNDLQKMKYTWWVACETMRFTPPVAGTFREAISDFTFAGFTIPNGWKAYWSNYTTNKNPEYFPEPEKFDPLRFEGTGPVPFSFMPFGGGPRMCPAKEYARVAILALMHNVVTKLEFKMVNPDEKIIYTPHPILEDGLLMQLASVGT